MVNVLGVKDDLQTASKGRSILLIAVSKMQSIELIKEAYSLGHRDFGENYVQELLEKSVALKEACPEIRWHFIGALQSNKIPQLMKVDRLVAIQTVDSLGKFEKIIRALEKLTNRLEPVKLFLQVNISHEEHKHGLKEVSEIIEIYQKYFEITKSVNPLNFTLDGLMMIGEIEAAQRDFQRMLDLRQELHDQLGEFEIKLSMGMSGDYQLAAEMGSDIVRVGTAIFGSRQQQV